MFIAALFTIARTWKQLKCPSTDEWIKKMWYIYTMEYYPAIKGTKLSHLQRRGWIQRLSYRLKSERERQIYRILTHICETQKNGTDEPVCRAEIETQMQRTNVWTARGESGRGGGDVMNWETGIDIYTLICMKQVTNKNLLYKKINKIKFKNSKKKSLGICLC